MESTSEETSDCQFTSIRQRKVSLFNVVVFVFIGSKENSMTLYILMSCDVVFFVCLNDESSTEFS